MAYNGEIISADSRQVYRGLDLGSGKDTLKVPQQLIDICEPEEPFTAADWRKRAAVEIARLTAAGKLPIIVGGTNLYLSALLENYVFAPPPSLELRESVVAVSTADLIRELEEVNPKALASLDTRNRRYLERAVEKTRLGWRESRQGERSYDALILLTDWPREELYKRIDERVDQRMTAGMLEEVRGLLARGVSAAWLRNLGLEYRYLTDYLEGRYSSLEEMVTRLKFAIHHFARRQLTWWRHRSHQVVPRADLGEAKRLVAEWQGDSI